jgi:hypothetical protein
MRLSIVIMKRASGGGTNADAMQPRAALHAADEALSAAQKALAAATATTPRGVRALARYAVELKDEGDETSDAEECTSWYLLPAIERSLAGLVGGMPAGGHIMNLSSSRTIPSITAMRRTSSRPALGDVYDLAVDLILFVRKDLRDDMVEEQRVSGHVDCDISQLPALLDLIREGLATRLEQSRDAPVLNRAGPKEAAH